MESAPLVLTVPLAVLLVGLGVLAALVARAGWTGALRPEGRLGARGRAASASPEAFALANRVAAPVVGGAAVVAVVVGLLVPLLGLGVAGTVVLAVVGLAGSVALLVAAGVLGERAARTVPTAAPSPGPGPGCGGCACGSGGCAGLSRAPGAPEEQLA